MQRFVIPVILLIGLMFWLAYRYRRENPNLALALTTAAVLASLLVIGGYFGLIGG